MLVIASGTLLCISRDRIPELYCSLLFLGKDASQTHTA